MKKIIYVILLFLLIFLVYYFVFKKSDNNNEIVKYELQTHEYFENLPKEDKYYISSVSELNSFYNLYYHNLHIDEKILNNNAVFIQVKQVGSGSIQMELKDVLIDKNVSFDIKESKENIGTADMAFWYFVAIIPKKSLENCNLDGWYLQSKIK